MKRESAGRYARQILLPEVGAAGQERLRRASALVVGAGGLGAPVLEYLAAAGVGRLTILDGDTVSASNLNRQLLYREEDLGKAKSVCAAACLRGLNSEVEITAIADRLTEENAREMILPHDVIALCVDSIEARHIANRACVALGKPFVDGAVGGFSGALLTVIPRVTPCFACVNPSFAEGASPVAVLGAMAGWVGAAEALAALRLLLGLPAPPGGALLFFDGKAMTAEPVPAVRNPGCPVCGGN